MADNEPERTDRPVITGLIALVAVAAVIGVIGGLAALVGSRVLGLDGDSAVAAEDSSANDASLYLPEPTITSETVVPEDGCLDDRGSGRPVRQRDGRGDLAVRGPAVGRAPCSRST